MYSKNSDFISISIWYELIIVKKTDPPQLRGLPVPNVHLYYSLYFKFSEYEKKKKKKKMKSSKRFEFFVISTL